MILTQSDDFTGDCIFCALNAFLCAAFVICYFYQFFYIAVPFFLKDKPHKPPQPNKIAVLISARNEEAVVKNLLDSLNAQTYARENFTVFVVADNCTDKTAAIAAANGAVVYERTDNSRVGKGYALEFLYGKIASNFGENHFDAYLILDADNVLDTRYIEEMNKTFSDGYEVLTSYRNSKNFGDNWISAGYALWFLRESEYLNHSRMLLNTSCAVSGTGFMFSAATIRKAGGWKFFLLTEDIEFTVYNILDGKKIGYARDAELFDEQPTTFPQSWRQRLRWARGYLQVWCKYGGSLLRNIFSKKFTSCYDMTMTIVPAFVISVLTILNCIVGMATGLILGWDLSNIALSMLGTLCGIYCTLLFIGALTTITQWEKIHAPAHKKILYTFTFPLFMLTYIPIAITALFKKVRWEPILHNRVKTLEEIRSL
ncbi:MAG: glycosyltransferase [Opitutae bacterium]|nr:glycosyltransferase [Opitutae bacterium]